MLVEILVPRLNANDDECTVVTNLVSVGDFISVGDELVELETDKTTFVVESTYSGLVSMLPVVGDNLEVNTPLVTIETNDSETISGIKSNSPEKTINKPDNFTVSAFELAKSLGLDINAFGEVLVTKDDVQVFFDQQSGHTIENKPDERSISLQKYPFIEGYVEPPVAYFGFSFTARAGQLEAIEYSLLNGIAQWQNNKKIDLKSFLLTKTEDTLIPVRAPNVSTSLETFKAELLSRQLQAFRGEKLKDTPDILISILRSNIDFSHTALLWPGSIIVLAIAICNKTMNVEIKVTYNHVYFDGNDMLDLAELMAL